MDIRYGLTWRRRITEIFPETIKRRLGIRRVSLAYVSIAVMVSGNLFGLRSLASFRIENAQRNRQLLRRRVWNWLESGHLFQFSHWVPGWTSRFADPSRGASGERVLEVGELLHVPYAYSFFKTQICIS